MEKRLSRRRFLELAGSDLARGQDNRTSETCRSGAYDCDGTLICGNQNRNYHPPLALVFHHEFLQPRYIYRSRKLCRRALTRARGTGRTYVGAGSGKHIAVLEKPDCTIEIIESYLSDESARIDPCGAVATARSISAHQAAISLKFRLNFGKQIFAHQILVRNMQLFQPLDYPSGAA